jgi:hypothetical protein
MPWWFAIPAVAGTGVRVYQGYRAARALQAMNQVAQQGARHASTLRAAQQAASSMGDQDPREPCEDCDVKCFNKPKGADEAEFLRQLKEQQDAINNLTADQLVGARDAIRAAGGTGPLRDVAAQRNARLDYTARRMEALQRTMSNAKAEQQVTQELSQLAATHRLDIIAGGNPSDISGLGDSRVNSSVGRQWRHGRAQQLENTARRMQQRGRGGEKMNVKLRKC